ncbi:MAG: GAF domain-containing protein [Desulfobacteraceae bacterium]|nr:MAG: GAF domain-containing protein [Desulfobacteraceae bacterium]
MLNLDGYDIIHEHPPKNGVILYSARHVPSAARVRIHFLPVSKHAKDLRESIYQHFLPLKRLISPHLARVYAIEKISETSASGIAFITGDPEGLLLKDYLILNNSLQEDKSSETFIDIALGLVSAVNDLHKLGLTHTGLTPSAIVIDPETHHACISDFAFGMVTVISPEGLDPDNKNQIALAEEYLPYISPEQTGRMNRKTDYRTDFYSLGVIFYEMLAGVPPFTGAHPMELIHAHMAKNPVMPLNARQKIGETLSDIIMKLLAKSPDSRYQSGFGIKSDLLEFRQRAGAGKALPLFQIACHDIPERFLFPDRMYGRDIELAMLMDEYNRVKGSHIGISMIAGYSGMGKSRIVEEIRRYVVDKGGYFISGQYEQFQQDIPYSGLIQAFGEIIRQILTGSADQISLWRHKLEAALGANAQIIIDVIPEVEFILGAQPPAPDLSPADAQNRFHRVFEKFLRVFAAREHPLTLFIDNMHWADAAGLKLMEAFFTGTRTRNFYFIGAYRTNEINGQHPLLDSIASIKRKGILLQTITLQPIRQTDICRLLADTLQENMDQVNLLAQIVHDKTRGNPFFVRQFLETINREGFLSYDYENGRWQWDIQQITAQRITDNVIDFMAEKVLKLTDNSQHILRLASCIGNTFSLPLLSLVAAKPSDEVLTDLREAVALGLVSTSGDGSDSRDGSQTIGLTGNLPATRLLPAEDLTFEFLHDKVRQAIYSLVPDTLKNTLHLKIGKLILQNTDPADLYSRIFSIAHHFNYGKNQLRTPADRLQAARLNLIAGKRAKDAAAHAQALSYLKTGETFLTDDAWQENYALIFDIKKQRMECEYLLHHFRNAEALFDLLLERASTHEDKAGIYNHKMIMLASFARHEEAVLIGAAGLRLLGVNVPKKVGKLELISTLLSLKFKLRHTQTNELLDLPEIQDPRLLLILKMMMNMGLSAYFCHPYLASFLALHIFKLTLEHGNSSVSPFAYVIYGSALSAIFKDYLSGDRYGKLALTANKKFGSTQMTAKVLLYYANAITVWRQPIHQVISLNREGLASARETGDLNYAIYHIQSLIFTMLAAGKPLDEISDECGRFYEYVEQSHDIGALYYLISVQQFIKCVRGETVHIHSLNDEGFSEARHVKNMQPEDIRIILCRHYLIKLRLLFIMEEYDGALQAARHCSALQRFHMGTIIIPEYYFFHCLVLAAIYPSASIFKKTLYHRQINLFRNRLKQLAGHCPENFEDKYLLIEAELARINGQDRQAVSFYQQAIGAAKANGFTQNHAIACEAAAKYYLSRGFEDIAGPYMAKAMESYRYWGAATKVGQITKKFSIILTTDHHPETFPSGQHLDFNAIVTALQTISTEIILEDLLKSLMKIVLENAGASKVQLLSITLDRIFLEAEIHIDHREAMIYKSLPAESRSDLFHPVLNYVKRTGTYVVVDDAGSHGDFPRDPYVMRHQPKSVLCLPVIRHSQMVALVYLENNITAAAFTPERIKVLRLLASQAAISLENSRLYEDVIKNEKQLREVSEKQEQDALRYQGQLRSLSSEVSLAEERERRRIASDLHDRIGHALANASMKLRLVKDSVSSADVSKYIDAIHLLIDQSIQDTQTLTFELSPPILYDLGLEAALDWLTEQTQQQHDIQVDFIDDLTLKPIDESLRILLFQATRELLHNVVKHARATKVRVAISRENAFVRIVIHDNGVGFEATKKETGIKKGGFGLFSIQERLKHQGGSLEITSGPDTGSSVTIVSPMTIVKPTEQENTEEITDDHKNSAGG